MNDFALPFDSDFHGDYETLVDDALKLIHPLMSKTDFCDRGLVEYLIFQDRLYQRATWNLAPWVKLVD